MSSFTTSKYARYLLVGGFALQWALGGVFLAAFARRDDAITWSLFQGIVTDDVLVRLFEGFAVVGVAAFLHALIMVTINDYQLPVLSSCRISHLALVLANCFLAAGLIGVIGSWSEIASFHHPLGQAAPGYVGVFPVSEWEMPSAVLAVICYLAFPWIVIATFLATEGSVDE